MHVSLMATTGFPGGTEVKNLPANAEDARNMGLVSGLGRLPKQSRKWQPTPVLLPGKLHRQRCLARYIVHAVSESDTTEQLRMQAHGNHRGKTCTRYTKELNKEVKAF